MIAPDIIIEGTITFFTESDLIFSVFYRNIFISEDEKISGPLNGKGGRAGNSGQTSFANEIMIANHFYRTFLDFLLIFGEKRD